MISKKNIFLIVVLIILGVAGFSVLRNKNSSEHTAHDHASEVTFLSRDEFETVVKEYTSELTAKNPRVVLDDIKEKIKTDEPLLRSCHSLVHEMGHVAFQKYKDFGTAMQYRDEVCNSGYIHGVIESYFSSSTDILSSMKTVCASYPTGKYISWECFHGIGHGLMFYTSNDLPKALSYCDTYTDAFARSSCANGAFMENVNANDNMHPSAFVNPKKPFFPCENQSFEHKNDCYIYAPTYYLSLHKAQYKDVLGWCDTAPLLFRNTCIQGAGAKIMNENLNDTKAVERFCTLGSTSKTNACIQGMADEVVNHFGSLTEATAMCNLLENSNKKTCLDAVKLYEPMFQ